MHKVTEQKSSDVTGKMLMAIEMGAAKWKVAFWHDGHNRVVDVEGDGREKAEALMEAIAEAKARWKLGAETEVWSVYEAGRDGFWPHRYLVERGVKSHVVDSSCILVDRKAKRRKTDSLDVRSLVDVLRAHLGGLRDMPVCRVPSEADEDLRRMHREVKELKQDRTMHINRIKSCLATVGVEVAINGKFPKALEEVRTPLGAELPEHLKRMAVDEYHRLKTVEAQMRERMQEEVELLAAQGSEAMKKVAQLIMLAGIGHLSAWTFVTEFFGWRKFSNRRQVAGALGLAPTPHESGELVREQGISKAGNPRVREMAIQIAWGWLRFQPNSAMSQWFNERFGKGKRTRRVGIVALARKLMVALWRYLEQGLVPTGARIKGEAPQRA